MSIGQRLINLRIERNLNRSKLARILGVSRTTVIAWETNKKEPSLLNAVCLCDYYKISLDYLAKGVPKNE